MELEVSRSCLLRYSGINNLHRMATPGLNFHTLTGSEVDVLLHIVLCKHHRVFELVDISWHDIVFLKTDANLRESQPGVHRSPKINNALTRERHLDVALPRS